MEQIEKTCSCVNGYGVLTKTIVVDGKEGPRKVDIVKDVYPCLCQRQEHFRANGHNLSIDGHNTAVVDDKILEIVSKMFSRHKEQGTFDMMVSADKTIVAKIMSEVDRGKQFCTMPASLRTKILTGKLRCASPRHKDSKIPVMGSVPMRVVGSKPVCPVCETL